MDSCVVFSCEDPFNPVPIARFALDANGDGYFGYGMRYLERDDAFSIDPLHLPLTQHVHKIPRHQDGTYGVLSDAGPNAWGMKLTTSMFRQQNRELPLTAVDWLMQCWHYGSGCLGFSPSATHLPNPGVHPAPFQDFSTRVIRAIESLATQVDAEVDKEVARLVFPGASLGGVRPKTVTMFEGVEHIAKFSRLDDRFDVPTVEYATMMLAHRAGIQVADFELREIGGRSVLLVARFDRTDDGRRLHYLSAKTLINIDTVSHDKREYKTRYSYAGIAEALRPIDPDAVKDSHELFRRMVFNIMVGNVDDHMRNHAVLKSEQGRYRLSPAFDLVPHLDAAGMPQSIGVGAYGAASTMTNAMSQCERFFLTYNEALQIIMQVRDVVMQWKSVFQEAGVSRNDIYLLGPCFDAAENAARELKESHRLRNTAAHGAVTADDQDEAPQAPDAQ